MTGHEIVDVEMMKCVVEYCVFQVCSVNMYFLIKIFFFQLKNTSVFQDIFIYLTLKDNKRQPDDPRNRNLLGKHVGSKHRNQEL